MNTWTATASQQARGGPRATTTPSPRLVPGRPPATLQPPVTACQRSAARSGQRSLLLGSQPPRRGNASSAPDSRRPSLARVSLVGVRPPLYFICRKCGNVREWTAPTMLLLVRCYSHDPPVDMEVVYGEETAGA